MKNLAKLFGITVLVVLIGLSVTACPTDGGGVGAGGVPNSSCPLGQILRITGEQVYTMGDDITFELFQNSLSINDGGIGGSGEVTNGQLSFTIDMPTTLKPLIQSMGYEEIFTNLQISPADTQGATLVLEIPDNPNYKFLLKTNMVSLTSPISTYTATMEGVSYIYVDRDVTMTGTGTRTEENGSLTRVTSDINISLKQGWNAMYTKGTTTMTQNNGALINQSFSAANPNHIKWVAIK